MAENNALIMCISGMQFFEVAASQDTSLNHWVRTGLGATELVAFTFLPMSNEVSAGRHRYSWRNFTFERTSKLVLLELKLLQQTRPTALELRRDNHRLEAQRSLVLFIREAAVSYIQEWRDPVFVHFVGEGFFIQQQRTISITSGKAGVTKSTRQDPFLPFLGAAVQGISSCKVQLAMCTPPAPQFAFMLSKLQHVMAYISTCHQ